MERCEICKKKQNVIIEQAPNFWVCQWCSEYVLPDLEECLK